MSVQDAFTLAGSWYLGGLVIGCFVGFVVGFAFFLRKWTSKAVEVSL